MNTPIRFLLLLAMPICVWAQTAELSGSLRDPQNAAVPEASVEVRNENTGALSKAKTNSDGLYSLPALNPGKYDLTVQANGFKTLTRDGIVLEVAQRARLDLTLEVGTVQETVSVAADAPLINSDDASVSTVVDRQFVENLPLNGRSLQSLITVTPGVVATLSGETGEQGQLSVAGQRAGSNYFTIDGVSANFAAPQTRYSGESSNGGLLAFSAVGSSNSLVSIDALQEFRLETSSYAPEFGRMSGAQTVLVTRSGTNSFHGTAFDYFRNDALDANDWFADSTRQQKPRERQNDFGGVLGGPIIKDHTFFFFSYEGLRAVQPTFSFVDVPSLDARQNAAPNIKALIDAFPLPNGPSTGTDLSQLAASISNRGRVDATSIRIDQSLGSNWTLFGRYDHSPSNLQLAGCGYTLTTTCQKHIEIDTATIGVTAILKPTVTNDFRVNYSRAHAVTSFGLQEFGGATLPPLSALFPSFVSPSSGFAPVLIGAGRSVGITDGEYTNHINPQTNIVDTVAVVRRTHRMKFGFDYRQLSPRGQPVLEPLAEWIYGGNPMPALVAGLPPDISEVIQGGNPPHLLFHNFAAFAQDTWQLTPRLTLTFGIRWDYNPPPTEASGNTYAFSEVTNLAAATLLPKGSPLWRGDWKNFAPRLGASYLLGTSKTRPTVIRMGFGQFYDIGTSTAGALDTGGGWFPYSLATVYCNRGVGPACTTPFPFNGPEPPFTFTQPYVQMWTFDPHLRLPYSLEWNVALEQSLSPNQTLRVSYLGSAGRRLLWDSVYSNPNPIVTSLYLTTNAGHSNFDSVQLQFQRRLTHGLQALISYAWSHSLDTNSADVRYTGSPSFNAGQDYGNSDFDIRHNFSAAVTYDIYSGHFNQRLIRNLIHGWSLDGITSARTGTPLTVTYTPVAPGSFNASGAAFPFRPDEIPGQPLYISDPSAPGGKRLNFAAFSIPPLLVQGSEPRNSLRGFPLVEVDLALRRQFDLGERIKLQFKAEGFNIINHPNFGNPVTAIGSCAQGVVCKPVFGWGTSQAMLNQSLGSGGFYGSGFGSLYQIGGPRSLQLSMKLVF